MAIPGVPIFALLAGGNQPLSLLDTAFNAVQMYINALGLASGGTTAGRPGAPVLFQPYFDTTLGEPIWCTSTSPVIWVNAAGVAV